MRRALPLLALVLAFAPAAEPQSATNLLRNPGAEAAAGGANGSMVVVPEWKPAGKFTAVQYGMRGFPGSGSGKNFFAGGPGSSRSSGTQVVDVSGSAQAIDEGRMQATLTASLGGFESQEDSARVEAAFFDEGGAPISGDALEIGPVTAADRGGQTKLIRKSATAAVPPRTRRIEVVITTERANGDYNDGYADDVSLTLQPSSRPAVVTKTYLWGGTVLAIGDSGATLISQTISGAGSARIEVHGSSSRVVSAPGDFRIVLLYRKPKGKKLSLSLRSTGAVSLNARPGGGGSIGVGVRVTASGFSNCRPGASGQITLFDGAGSGPDSVLLGFCGARTRYVDGGSHHMRVRVTIGEKR